MPRYYFHLFDGDDHPDKLGTVLEDSVAARSEGLRFVEALLTERDMLLALGIVWTLRVADEDDNTVLNLEVRTK